MTGSGEFPYAERALSVEEARKAVKVTFRVMWDARIDRRDPNAPAAIAWREAVDRFGSAIRGAYPPGFRNALAAVKQGDRAGLGEMIAFLEADPWFFRSGYVKADILRALPKVKLEPDEAERLRAVVLDIVDRRDGREFRDYCNLGRRLATPELRAELEKRARSTDRAVKRRAEWVLTAMGHALR